MNCAHRLTPSSVFPKCSASFWARSATEKYLDYIGGIRESGEHLLDLISDILDMSKIEAGKYELDLEELNLAKVIRLAVHMIEGRAQDARIKITDRSDNEDLQLVADRRALMQILLNLLSNAEIH